MKTRKIYFQMILLQLCLLFSSEVLSYETNVHEIMAEQAFNVSDLSTGHLNNLNISQNDKFDNLTLVQLLKLGSNREDDLPRWRNHFYDPVTNRGLNFNGTDIGSPSLQWGEDHTDNAYDWGKARFNYHSALTALNSSDRNNAFAFVFSTLGRLMHLIHDKAVPAHVRNDAHFPYANGQRDMYERYTRDAANGINNCNPLQYGGYAPVDLQTFNTFDSFWTNSGIGLAEFTNSNFVSRNTNVDDQAYALPVGISDLGIYTETVNDPEAGQINVNVKYLLGYVTDQYRSAQSPAVRLAAYSYFDFESQQIANQPVFSLNNQVHREYANFLVPRAVGYSAGLLNYFFRGELGVTTVPGGLKIKNLSAEAMTTYEDSASQTIGSFGVYYDNLYNERHLLTTYNLTSSLDPGQEITISFASPTDNIKPCKYIVVFRGKLGNEEGAVIGKVAVPPSVYYVANTNEGWKIMKSDADGTNQSVVYNNIIGQVIGRIAVSPDGSTIAFSGSPDGLILNTTIQLLDLTDPAAEPRVLTAGNWPSWSPDGRKIVFEREQDIGGDANFDVFTVDVATGATSQLTSDGDSMEPAWSSNGNTIAFTQFEPAEANCNTLFVIYLISTAGNPIGPLTCPPEGEYMSDGDFEPAWSPNSQEIAFTRQKYFGRANQLHKVNVATRTITKLTESPDVGYDEFTPAWSSDGTSIAIGSSRDGDYDIWMVNAQGDGYTANLTNANPNTDGYPAFGK